MSASASPEWLKVEPARVKRMVAGELRKEQRAWKATQKHQQLHEERTRIIVDRSSQPEPDCLTLPLCSPCEEKELPTLSIDDPLRDHYTTMKQQMRDELLALQRLIASPERVEAGEGAWEVTTEVEEEDRRLPLTTSSLLGVFSPHLVSRHLPVLHSYPTFHFGKDAFQPHLATCYTLNQARQLLHRVQSQLSSHSSSLSSLSFAYSISSGVGRLSAISSVLHSHSGERLLDLLRGWKVTNVLLIVLGRASRDRHTASLEAQQTQQRDRLRLIVQTAKLLLKDHLMCIQEVEQDLNTHVPKSDGSTFLTQPAEVEDERPVGGTQTARQRSADLRPLTSPVAVLPSSPALQLRLQHTERQSHYLFVNSAFSCPLTHSAPQLPTCSSPSPTPPVYWTLDDLRTDMMAALSVSPATEASLVTSSLLCKLFHLQSAVPQEEAMMVSEEVYRRVKEWVTEQRRSGGLAEQRVQDWATVREAVWSCYLLHMKLLRPSFRPSELQRVARTSPTPHFAVRLLCAAVAAVLGWEDEQWEAVRGCLGAYRAGPVEGEMAELGDEGVMERTAEWGEGGGGLGYGQRRVGGDGCWGEWGEDAGEGYLSDVWAHLMGVKIGDLGEEVVRKVEVVLMERALQWSEVRALDGGEGWVGLLEWLTLVLRCERLWTVARGLFTVDITAGPT